MDRESSQFSFKFLKKGLFSSYRVFQELCFLQHFMVFEAEHCHLNLNHDSLKQFIYEI